MYSWARNPKSPQVPPFRHQMGRHPTIWDFKNRDPAQNSGPDLAVGVPGPKSQLCFRLFWTQNCKQNQFSGRVLNLSTTHSNGFGAQGPNGAHGAPVHGPPKGPRGPRGPRGARPWAAQGAQGPTGRQFMGRPRVLGAHGAPGNGPPKGPKGPNKRAK